MNLGVADLNILDVEVQRLTVAGRFFAVRRFRSLFISGCLLLCSGVIPGGVALRHDACPVAVAVFVNVQAGIKPVKQEGVDPR